MAGPSKKDGGHAGQSKGHDGEIPDHPLVSALRPSPDQSPTRVVLTGYHGSSKDPSRIRLYLGLDFQSYYEFPRAEIVHHWPIDPDDENSPTRIVIEGTAQLDLVVGSVPGTTATFLQGEIVSAYLAEAIRSASSSNKLITVCGIPTCAAHSQHECRPLCRETGHVPTCQGNSSNACVPR